MVFGLRAGKFAGQYCKQINEFKNIPTHLIENAIELTLAPFDEKKTENPFSLHQELREMMTVNYGLSTDESLKDALEKLKSFKERALKCKATGSRTYNPSWHHSLDMLNLIQCAKMTIKASLIRKESRGGHQRGDYLDLNPDLQDIMYVLSKGENGEIKIHEEINEKMSDELQKVIDKFEK